MPARECRSLGVHLADIVKDDFEAKLLTLREAHKKRATVNEEKRVEKRAKLNYDFFTEDYRAALFNWDDPC